LRTVNFAHRKRMLPSYAVILSEAFVLFANAESKDPIAGRVLNEYGVRT
jgi:hypothetical protein